MLHSSENNHSKTDIVGISGLLISIFMLLQFFTGWTKDQILCNVYFKILICLALTFLLVFIIPRLVSKFKTSFKRISYLISFIVCVLALIYFPKGNCTVLLPINKDSSTFTPVISPVPIYPKDSIKSVKPIKKHITHMKLPKADSTYLPGNNNHEINGNNNKVGVNGDFNQ